MRTDQPDSTDTRVVITGLDIPFRDLVNILVKLALAAIPAVIVVAFIWFVAAAFLADLLGGNR